MQRGDQDVSQTNPYLQIHIESDRTKLTITKQENGRLLIEMQAIDDEQYYLQTEVDAEQFSEALAIVTGRKIS